MNVYAVIILITLLVSHLLEMVAETLNLKALREELPEEFKGIYDAEKYRKSQEYTRVRTRFGWWVSSFWLLVTLFFWFWGGFNQVDQFIRQWELGPIWSGLAYIGVLLVARFILGMPFTIYSTFVIEERFGFNKTTLLTFILDIVKSILIGTLIGALLLGGMLSFFEYAGAYAWLYCWIATTIFGFLLQFVAPTWIMPLFNKFTPLAAGELREALIAYARSVNFSLKNVFEVDGSRRSAKSNAFFTGFGKNKRIALFDTLIKQHTVAELIAIFAHEVGHYKKKHLLQGMLISLMHTGIMFYLLSIFLTHEGLFKAFYMEQVSIYAGFIFFGMLYTPVEMILSIVMQIFSRKNEYEADQFAAESIDEPENMVNALKKLSVHNLSNLTPHPFYVFLNYSHPPVLERIRRIRENRAAYRASGGN